MHINLHNLYCSENIICIIKSTMVRLARHVAHMGDTINANKFLVGDRETRLEGVDWVNLAEDRDWRWARLESRNNICSI